MCRGHHVLSSPRNPITVPNSFEADHVITFVADAIFREYSAAFNYNHSGLKHKPHINVFKCNECGLCFCTAEWYTFFGFAINLLCSHGHTVDPGDPNYTIVAFVAIASSLTSISNQSNISITLLPTIIQGHSWDPDGPIRHLFIHLRKSTKSLPREYRSAPGELNGAIDTS